MPLTLQSSAFPNHGAIPRRYTCDGEEFSPPLAWSGVPEGTKSFVLIVDDPDAPEENVGSLGALQHSAQCH